MATYNQRITDEDEKFLDVSDFFGNSSGTLSLNSDVFGATNAGADCVGRGGIAWNPEVTAVGQQGSFSKIPLASHDGFHDCKQFFYNVFDMYTEDGADSLNFEDIALDSAQEGSISLFAEQDDHETIWMPYLMATRVVQLHWEVALRCILSLIECPAFSLRRTMLMT